MRKALIICNGEPEQKNFLAKACKGKYILCVDGGANTAAKYNIKPDAIVGDMDSVSSAARKKFASSAWIQVNRQDNTDFEKALNFIKQAEIKDVTIISATGKRLDFTLSNLYSAFKYLKNTKIVFESEFFKIVPVTEARKFKTMPGARVSLIPVSACKKVNLKGLKYPLKNANLKVTDTLTLSNEASAKEIEISLEKGRILVYIEK